MDTTGWIFVGVLLLGAVLYATAGIVYNWKVEGVPGPSREALPHREFWGEIAGLCADGLALVVGGVTGAVTRPQGGAGYRSVPAVAEEPQRTVAICI